LTSSVMAGNLLFGSYLEDFSTFFLTFNLRIFEIFRSAGFGANDFSSTNGYYYIVYFILATFLFNWIVVQMIVSIVLDTYIKMQLKYRNLLRANVQLNNEKNLIITKKWIDFLFCRNIQETGEGISKFIMGIFENFKKLKVIFNPFPYLSAEFFGPGNCDDSFRVLQKNRRAGH
jgi:hypothetical protein